MPASPLARSESPPIRSFHHDEFTVDRLLRSKGDRSVSICLPARNEATTIGPIVAMRRRAVVDVGAADGLIVIDDGSSDATAAEARANGAEVVRSSEVLPEFGDGHGKGGVLWKSLHVSTGDVVVWCDTDIEDFHPRFVTGILGPLLCEPDVEFVKGYYDRPERNGTGGGRVSELVARPLLSLLYPDLAALFQPLSGEYGGTRAVLEQLPFVDGYGVDVGLLIDFTRLRGIDRLVQVNLDVRLHRNRDLAELGPQAMAVMQTILRRVDPDLVPVVADLVRPGRPDVSVAVSERPPLAELRSRRDRS